MDPVAPVTNTAPAPRHMPDARPAADAAALPRDSRPPAESAPILPKSVSQLGAIGRNLLETARVEPGETAREVRRVLKPFGVEMLPREPVPAADVTLPQAEEVPG